MEQITNIYQCIVICVFIVAVAAILIKIFHEMGK